MPAARKPKAGDRVILRGTIVHMLPDLGTATVTIDRADPDGAQWFSVQTGALEHDMIAELPDGGEPGGEPDAGDLDLLLRSVALAADMASLERLGRPDAERTAAAVRAALACALGNGMIELVPPERWPELVVTNPPYSLEGNP